MAGAHLSPALTQAISGFARLRKPDGQAFVLLHEAS